MAKVKSLIRTFEVKHNGEVITLDDPNPDFTIEEVQKFYSSVYPEIINSAFAEPEIKDDKITYKVSTVTGTKG